MHLQAEPKTENHCFFLDWTEPPASPWLDCAVRKFNLKFNDLPSKYAPAVVGDGCDVWVRTDGIFVFCLEFKPSERAIAERSEKFDDFAINLAHLVSEQIKSAIFDLRSTATGTVYSSRSHPEIVVKPIKVSIDQSNIHTGSLENALRSDQFVYGICAKIRDKSQDEPPKTDETLFYTPRDRIPAVILLRRQYGRCYDKAMHVRRDYRDRQLQLFGINTRFRLFSAQHVILLWVLISITFIVMNFDDAVMPESVSMSELWPFFEAIPNFIFLLIALGAVPVVFTYWILVVRKKRDNTISAYDRARGLLQLGNYFHAISTRVVLAGNGTAEKPAYAPQNFDLLIERLDEHKRIELEKRSLDMRRIRWIGIPGVFIVMTLLGFPEFLLAVLESPWLEGWMNLFDLLDPVNPISSRVPGR